MHPKLYSNSHVRRELIHSLFIKPSLYFSYKDVCKRRSHMFVSLSNIALTTLLIWLACHFVGDFAFQSAWMTIEKGKSWEVNFYHGATYTAPFLLFAHCTPLAAIVLFATHI